MDAVARRASESPNDDRDRGSGLSPRSAHPFTRIRSNDSAVRALVTEAAAESYTVSQLLDLVERSNVIVYLDVSVPPDAIPTSQTRLLAGRANGCRYLSVWIDRRLSPRERIEMLGHELQHVAEIADAVEVGTEADLLRLYQRIGYTSWSNRAFETFAARVVQMLVGQELRSDPDAATNPHERVPSADSADSYSRQLFGAYCAACHGSDGKGGGPAARVMKALPPDLTVLSKSSGGLFPWSRVELSIRSTDRRPPVSIAEGMPVWRPVSSHEPPAGPADHARDIAAYVESLQRR
jgi:mono/diheme cytochrome c family protein